MAPNPEQYRLSLAEHQTIFEQEIKPDLFAGVQPSSQPLAIIFGGQPGSGKSAAVDAAQQELALRGGTVTIIGDDLRGYHPRYFMLMADDDKTAAFYTDRDVGQWVEKAIDEARSRRINVIIEGTMRDGDKVAATMAGLRTAGYAIDVRALAVPFRLSEQGILQRYETQKATRGVGRMTTPEAHRAAYDGMLRTIERIESDKLAERVTIYRRGNEAIYTNELCNGQWMHEPQAQAAIEAERTRPMSKQEHLAFVQGFNKLAAMLAKPERQASSAEIGSLEILRRQAYAALLGAETQPQKDAAKLKILSFSDYRRYREKTPDSEVPPPETDDSTPVP